MCKPRLLCDILLNLLCFLQSGVIWSSEPSILVNEIVANTSKPLEDAIELFNATNADVNIGGWYLTDDSVAPQKFRIPDGTIIAAGGYVVFLHSQFKSSFGLSGLGDRVYLFSADSAGNLTGYSNGFVFGASESGVSFGRYTISTGEDQFPPQVSRTLGTLNAGPLVGPVVISEIMYNPLADADEFIELHNITPGAIPLFDPALPSNTWKLTGVGFAFPPNIEIPANGLILVVGIDPIIFRSKYLIPNNVQVLGPFSSPLSNHSMLLELKKPIAPVIDSTSGTVTVPFVVVDTVHYSDSSPWPTNSDGGGPSLERINLSAYGNDPVNWHAIPISGGSPGFLRSFDTDEDGFSDADEQLLGTNPVNFLSRPGGSADFDSDGKTDDTDLDDDNDGVSDKNEIADGTNPYSALSLKKIAMTIRKLSGTIIFNAAGRDRTAVAGQLMSVPPLSDATGLVAIVNIGGARTSFTLDGKGRAKSANGSVSLRFRPSRRNPTTGKLEFLGGPLVFKAKLSGTFGPEWAALGMVPTLDIHSGFLNMPIDISFNGRAYGTTAITLYSSKHGQGGRFRQ